MKTNAYTGSSAKKSNLCLLTMGVLKTLTPNVFPLFTGSSLKNFAKF